MHTGYSGPHSTNAKNIEKQSPANLFKNEPRIICKIILSRQCHTLWWRKSHATPTKVSTDQWAKTLWHHILRLWVMKYKWKRLQCSVRFHMSCCMVWYLPLLQAHCSTCNVDTYVLRCCYSSYSIRIYLRIILYLYIHIYIYIYTTYTWIIRPFLNHSPAFFQTHHIHIYRVSWLEGWSFSKSFGHSQRHSLWSTIAVTGTETQEEPHTTRWFGTHDIVGWEMWPAVTRCEALYFKSVLIDKKFKTFGISGGILESCWHGILQKLHYDSFFSHW